MIVNGQSYLLDKLNRMLREEWTPVQVWELRQFTNDYTPVGTSVPADFTEATYGGYGRHDILPEVWAEPTIVGGEAVALYGESPLSWTCTGDPETVHGYWVHDLVAERVVWAERLESPAVLTVGSVLLIQPRYREADYVVCP